MFISHLIDLKEPVSCNQGGRN